MNSQITKNNALNKQIVKKEQILPATGHDTNWLSVFGGGLMLIGAYLYRRLKRVN
ncbi:LPXTG cell wall anchor domain-containing protein [Bacillus toyonensis]|uniref:LPXTG cell wall anchor domain-containing protein n=1 Tax=Bacillus TaxID=1386 RepID=UPI000CBA44B0|nr:MULTISPECIES: LPXTG cell wall anchor domain-containing protein [Bacillus cereus group]MCU4766643.1 LPXTG cell wall anchor domain-containing protein [Bacillus toyonensis]MDM5258113.1 LPXTG cell wall anchor domain-containing protein [Bacillus toyonensis]MDR4971145.1 LPXTG cell wall anchor domain-containing protein [Bacillus toyonensis]PKR93313.1 LPXTG-domain-containing protein [Bacillus cereus Rock4-18]